MDCGLVLWYGPRFVRRRTTSLAPLLVALVIAALAAAMAPERGVAEPSVDRLRAERAALESRSASALLELYALDTRAAAARAEVTRVMNQRERLERERAAVQRRLGIARASLDFAERRLGARLRALYQEGEVDPLAILLGADSIDEAMAALDGLGFAADHDRGLIRGTEAARRKLVAQERTLATRTAALRRAETAAASRAAALERARAERSAYVAQLAREKQLKTRELAALEAQAAAASRKAAAVTEAAASPRARAAVPADAPAAAPVTTPTTTPTPPAAPASPPAAGGARTLTVVATGYALPGRTATGIRVAWGVVAVDPAVIPLGTRMTIPGYGEGVAADTGGAVRGAHIDLWFPSRAQALAWGRRSVTITLH